MNEGSKQRSLLTAQISAYSGSQSGAESESVRPFSFEKIAAGIYKVVPKEDLANGEYGFYYGGNAAGPYGVGGAGGKVYDFGINGSPETEPKPDSKKKSGRGFGKKRQ